MCVLVSQSYLTLCDPKDIGLPVFSVHRILQEKNTQVGLIPFSRALGELQFYIFKMELIPPALFAFFVE